jgi:DNA-binding transcriptional LysR family regulator
MIDIKFTLVQLEMFLAVVDYGSFSAAARALDRAQSAVSHSVGQLEASLKVAVFDRSGRTPVLTAAGQILSEEARSLLRQARELESLAESWGAMEGQAQFSLVVDLIFPVDTLVDILAALRELHPRLALTVHTEARGAVTARLLQEDCHLGVTGILVPDLSSRMETTRIGAIDFMAVAAPGHPLASWNGPIPMEELRRHTQIILEDRSYLSTDQQVGVVGTNTWRVGGQGAKLGLLRAGFGYGSMPLHMIGEDLESGRLVGLEPSHWARPQLEIPLYAIHPADRPPGPVTRDTIRLLRELAPGAARLRDRPPS